MSRGPARWKSSDIAWSGERRPYDLFREFLFSFVVILVLVVGLSVLFSSPDPPPVTFQQWAEQGTKDFAATTLSEIDGTSESATYGPPYQSTAQNGSTQALGPISPETWLGNAFPVAIPVDPYQDFVATPLSLQGDADVKAALDVWSKASADQQTAWAQSYYDAIGKGSAKDGVLTVTTSAAQTGPLDTIVQAQLAFARSGGLDAALLYTNSPRADGYGTWYSNDQTFAMLYFGDSGEGGGGTACISPGDPLPADGDCWFYNQSVANVAPRNAGYLAGGTWGIMNEVGNWPGAWWLFPYTSWYQWGYGATGASGDLYVMVMTVLFALPFIFLPWIPGLRDIPKATRVYKLMWSDYYQGLRERR
jgi:hypothetical protein